MKGIRIINRAEKQSAEILIYEDIGEGFWTSGVTAQGFLKDLRALGDVKSLDIRINSNGGSVFDGVAIYNALRQHSARKTVHVDGIAASIASIIAMAGDEIRMGEGAWMMIHDPSGLAMGTAEQMRETADLLDGIKSQLVDIYVTRTGKDAAEIGAIMAAETWFNASDAIDFKLADMVSEPIKIAAHAGLQAKRFQHIPGELLASALKAKFEAEPPTEQPEHPTLSQPPGPPVQQEPTASKEAVFISTTPKGNPMNALQLLQARAVDHKAAADGIVEKARNEERPMTANEMDIVNNHMAEFDQAQAEIQIINRMEAADSFLNQSAGRESQRAPAVGLQNTHLPTASEKGRWGFSNLGEYAKSVRNAVLNPGQMDTRLIKNATASTYSTESVGPDGGFAVPPEYRAEIQSLVMGESSILSQCDAMPTDSNRVTVPTDETTAWQTSGGVLAYWGSEAGTMTQSKAALKEVGVSLHKLYALVPVSDEMQEDAPLISRYLTNKSGEKIDFKITNAIVNGTGAGQPLGILNAPGTVSVAKEGSQAADTIVGNNILKMYARQLNPGRAVWLCNSDTLVMLLSMNIEFKSSAGAGIAAGARFPTITMPGENGNTFATIMGRPVIVTEACATLGDVGDVIFADLAGGYFAPYKAGGIRNDISMHLWFDQGLTAYKWTFRVGGQPWLSSAVTPASGSANTKSSMVTLAAR